MLRPSCGISQCDISCTRERDKRCVNVPQRRRLISRPDEGQRHHDHALHRTQGKTPGRDTADTNRPFLDFDNTGERWKEKEEVFWLRPSYTLILMLYTRTVYASHISSFSPLLVVVVCLRCFHLAKLNNSPVYFRLEASRCRIAY